MAANELILRYGCNPHQVPARVYVEDGELPFQVLNGTPGYINMLDALNSWQLVKELKQVLGLPAAASFKHVSPSGSAVGLPMNEVLRKACFVDDLELSPLAAAYARARGTDRMSSFGDWAALSERVDVLTARLISREVSDGVIAPDFEPEALEILRKKQGGRYKVLAIDPDYKPLPQETRQIFGVTFEQHINDRVIKMDDLDRIVTQNRNLPTSARRDMTIAWITLKYTQSNSVCFAYDGQTIGVGAGQQSRIHCTRLAASKAERWWLRQHAALWGLPFRTDIGRPTRDNAIDQFLQGADRQEVMNDWQEIFTDRPVQLGAGEITSWLGTLTDVALGSDAFFPFRDSIDHAARTGVRYVLQPGGSNRDADVVEACDQYGMVMVFSGVRLFHH